MKEYLLKNKKLLVIVLAVFAVVVVSLVIYLQYFKSLQNVPSDDDITEPEDLPEGIIRDGPEPTSENPTVFPPEDPNFPTGGEIMESQYEG